MKINLDRIRLNVTLSEDSRQALNPLSADDATDVILNPGAKNPTQSRKKLPFPVPQTGPKLGRGKKWTELQKSLQDAAVKDSVIAPHSTSLVTEDAVNTNRKIFAMMKAVKIIPPIRNTSGGNRSGR